jgi:hypothetical protein
MRRPTARALSLFGGSIILFLGTACGPNDAGADPPAPDGPAAGEPDSTAILVRGRITPEQLELEPAFRIQARSALPLEAEGAHRLRGIDATGGVLFDLAFDGAPLADPLAAGEEHFVIAVPLSDAHADRLETIEVHSADGRRVSRRATMAQDQLAREIARTDIITAERTSDGDVRVSWDSGRFPMVAILDPRTGQVLAFGRDGEAGVRTRQDTLDVLISEGVRSGRRTVVVR